MEIKVTYQCEVVGVIDLQVASVINLMRKIGYSSFNIRSQVAKYDYFASFKNEDTDEYISIYPDKSFIKYKDCRISIDELLTVTDIIRYYIEYTKYEKESESHEEESE